jgi:hypothetical protein
MFHHLPVMADCERGLGNPLKALNLAGSPEVKRLAKPEEIEMRIVAAGARRDLGELDAAVVTLTCKELNNETDEWAAPLFYFSQINVILLKIKGVKEF